MRTHPDGALPIADMPGDGFKEHSIGEPARPDRFEALLATRREPVRTLAGDSDRQVGRKIFQRAIFDAAGNGCGHELPHRVRRGQVVRTTSNSALIFPSFHVNDRFLLESGWHGRRGRDRLRQEDPRINGASGRVCEQSRSCPCSITRHDGSGRTVDARATRYGPPTHCELLERGTAAYSEAWVRLADVRIQGKEIKWQCPLADPAPDLVYPAVSSRFAARSGSRSSRWRCLLGARCRKARAKRSRSCKRSRSIHMSLRRRSRFVRAHRRWGWTSRSSPAC